MATTPSASTSARPSAVQQLEAARTRHTALQQRYANASAQLTARKALLEAAQQEAKQLFGTADLTELRALHARLTQENQTAVTDFLDGLTRVETALADLESLLSS